MNLNNIVHSNRPHIIGAMNGVLNTCPIRDQPFNTGMGEWGWGYKVGYIWSKGGKV